MTNNYNGLVTSVLQCNSVFRDRLIKRSFRALPFQKLLVLNECIEDENFRFRYNPTAEPVTMVCKPDVRADLVPLIYDKGNPLLMYYETKGSDIYLVLGKDIHTYSSKGEKQGTTLKEGTFLVLTKTEVSCLLEVYPEFFGRNNSEDVMLDYFKRCNKIRFDSIKRVTLGELLLYTTKGDPMLKMNPDLYLSYLRCAKTFFTYESGGYVVCYLPTDVCVSWSSRLRKAAGCTQWHRNRGSERECHNIDIKLSTPYHTKFPDEVYPTLLHEMVHVFLPSEGHSSVFKKEIDRLSQDSGYEVTLHSRECAVANWYLYCPHCGSVYKRTNRPKYSYLCECGTELEIYSVEDFAELVELGVIATNETVTR